MSTAAELLDPAATLAQARAVPAGRAFAPSPDVRRAAMDALAYLLADRVAALRGRAKAVDADEEEGLQPGDAPALRVMWPGRPTLAAPWMVEDAERPETAPGHYVVQVGTWEGQVEIRVLALSARERERLGRAVLDVFGAGAVLPSGHVLEHSIMVTMPAVEVSGQPTGYVAQAWFSLTDDGWEDERTFEKKRYVTLLVDAWVPELQLRDGTGTMDTIEVTVDQVAPAADVAQPAPGDVDSEWIFTVPQ